MSSSYTVSGECFLPGMSLQCQIPGINEEGLLLDINEECIVPTRSERMSHTWYK